jgi:AraC-like DNA-binding protein
MLLLNTPTTADVPLLVKNIYRVIDDMIDDPSLGASKLAALNAMSLRTLNRRLNAMLGVTACDLIRQYRLQKSVALLKAGHNVSESAYMVGFETPAYFSQCFKEQYGVSPKDFNQYDDHLGNAAFMSARSRY